MKRVFISQPMRERSAQEILDERYEIIRALKEKYGEHVEDINYFSDFEDVKGVKNKPLRYLGASISALSEADVAVFVQGYAEARGCRIEHEAAVVYNVERVYV